MAIKREKGVTTPVIGAVNAELQTNQQRAELEKVRMLWFRVAVIVALAVVIICSNSHPIGMCLH